MLVVETIGRIRRERFVKGKSIKEIARSLGVSSGPVLDGPATPIAVVSGRPVLPSDATPMQIVTGRGVLPGPATPVG